MLTEAERPPDVSLPYLRERLRHSARQRKHRWEFWPAWRLYWPIVLQILRLAIRHRSPTLFTCVNPGMPAGGLIGDSKAAILEQLDDGTGAVGQFRLIPPVVHPAERLQALHAFLAETGLNYPVVLKPDAGQRGLGVRIIRDPDSASQYLAETPVPVLAQEYLHGDEFGIFHARFPDEQRGQIISVTRKRMTAVTGDGKRSLARLILDDDRAVCLAPRFLHSHRARLREVPAPGRIVPLVEIGTHSRGSLFLDGADLITPRLTNAIDRIARPFEGFHFGRFDIRAPDEESVRNGRGLRVIELNGITSECTHMYDPRFSLAEGRRILADQWRLAFEIAAANRRNGARPDSLRAIWRHLADAKKKQDLVR